MDVKLGIFVVSSPGVTIGEIRRLGAKVAPRLREMVG
jgi:hypothetical protein